MSELKTLRATPTNAFPNLQRTYDFLQHQVHFFGQTVGLKRSVGQKDYFDIEFKTREGAMETLQECHVKDLDFEWAPCNFAHKMATGLAVVSFQPPRFDYGVFCEEPSLPLPCNNPYPNKWTTPKTKKRKRNEQQEPEPIPEAVCHYARRVQPPPVNPCPPFDTREWPKFPRYSTLVNSA
ncbi:hypothetical protein CFC21_060456 [Triticum aestivum]|uniref:Uncharacterized protein n=3 Tax=Triticinae TaxID=1648030 RepID=A0A453H7T1_AEGTS|nr:uncharacterized protein LOC109734808 [Aegilops tauschii subsp. strangulata]XP_044373394.1 uncharacterized protein LOC123095885 [Triticum aestivum]KAF7052345.1 hypothetical protein CFC21_060456 [Triticum aestivum]